MSSLLTSLFLGLLFLFLFLDPFGRPQPLFSISADGMSADSISIANRIVITYYLGTSTLIVSLSKAIRLYRIELLNKATRVLFGFRDSVLFSLFLSTFFGLPLGFQLGS